MKFSFSFNRHTKHLLESASHRDYLTITLERMTPKKNPAKYRKIQSEHILRVHLINIYRCFKAPYQYIHPVLTCATGTPPGPNMLM